MDNEVIVRISVQNLIDFTLQSGDLGSGFLSPSRAAEGTKGHHMVRKTLKENLPEDALYNTEVPISYIYKGSHVVIEVTGRIDGIIINGSNVTIHEIKTTTLPVSLIEHDHNMHHWSQALCYAYIYSYLQKLDRVDVRLTYFNVDDKDENSFTDNYDYEKLEAFFLPLVQGFLEWQELLYEWQDTRNDSIKQLGFPYESYRKGQRNLAAGVYKCIRDKGMLFVQAPTGTGKTMATLFPAVKALGEGAISRIFYLTSKTTTRQIAEKALDDLRGTGLRLKSITITAKEKTCLNESFICDPEFCSYAKDYYGRVKSAIKDAIKLDCLDRMLVEETAAIHKVCPFELSLDLSLLCDVIICDYNYLFDPRVYLKRFFMNSKKDYCFLIDEAHNLVDRARDMYSADIYKKTVFELRRSIKNELPELYGSIDQIYKYILKAGKELTKDNEEQESARLLVNKEPPEGLSGLLSRFTEIVEHKLSKGLHVSFQDELLDTYYSFQNFIRIQEIYDDKYVTYYERSARDLKIKLFCIDPSKLLKLAMDRGITSILFSATLSPSSYFVRMLGGDENSKFMLLPSPFLKENLCVFVDDTISTKFKTRHLSYDCVAENILEVAKARIGNYMVFFPSFDYLREVYVRFLGIQTGVRTVYQVPGMSEGAREEFLNEFENVGETSLVGFTVLGGVFGEGIDLTGDKLTGAIIVGVGLPLLCNERNIIRNYFDDQSGNGFQYAYVFPGINKVLQAAGRVIRTETDRGMIILLDERFSNYGYRDLLPAEWHPLLKASDGILLEDALHDFFVE